jgi:hypothetical protein
MNCSFLGLATTALLQFLIVWLRGSVALPTGLAVELGHGITNY